MSERVIESRSAQDTYALGMELGQRAVPGQILALSGDLGAGKTVLAQGLAAGLGVQGPVSSPTFTIMQVYEDGRLPYYHFDVYRISDVDEMDAIGWEEYLYGRGVCLIEWADLVEEALPESAVRITIEKDAAQGYDYRRIRIRNQDASGPKDD